MAEMGWPPQAWPAATPDELTRAAQLRAVLPVYLDEQVVGTEVPSVQVEARAPHGPTLAADQTGEGGVQPPAGLTGGTAGVGATTSEGAGPFAVEGAIQAAARAVPAAPPAAAGGRQGGGGNPSGASSQRPSPTEAPWQGVAFW